MKSITFLNYISTNINEPINNHNTYYNTYWDKYKQNLIPLLHILIEQIISIKIPIIQHKQHIKWETFNNKYPLCYTYYNTHNEYIDYKTYIHKFNIREISFDYIEYENYINKFIKNKLIIDIYNKFQNGIFISLDVRLYVENNINNLLYYSFPHIDLYILYNDVLLDETTKNTLLNNIYVISKWIYDLNPIKKITLYYFDTLISKKLIDDYNYICSQNINSGLSSKTYIIIWRREEILKVLIHELIHFLQIDNKHNDNITNIINYTIGNINYPIIINEAITELQALFLHTLYIITINSKSNDNDFIINHFKLLFNLEQIYGWYQFSKIMNFYKINSFELKSIKSNFNQSSNAYSYYILKCIFNMYFFNILNELNYIKQLINKQYIPNLEHVIKNIIDNLPIVFLNKIIKDFKIKDKSLKLTLFNTI
jgi:hypothetical protein